MPTSMRQQSAELVPLMELMVSSRILPIDAVSMLHVLPTASALVGFPCSLALSLSWPELPRQTHPPMFTAQVLVAIGCLYAPRSWAFISSQCLQTGTLKMGSTTPHSCPKPEPAAISSKTKGPDTLLGKPGCSFSATSCALDCASVRVGIQATRIHKHDVTVASLDPYLDPHATQR